MAKNCFQVIQKNGLNLLSNYWCLRCANQVKFTDECIMYTEKYVLVKKMFTNGLDIDLPQSENNSWNGNKLILQ